MSQFTHVISCECCKLWVVEVLTHYHLQLVTNMMALTFSGLFSHRDIAEWNASKQYKKTLSTETSDDSGFYL